MFNRAMQQLIASTGMPSRKRILLLGYMLLAVLYVQAQWNIYSYVEQRKNQQDLLSKLTGTSIQKGYVFFGNSESHLDNVRKTGYTLPLVSTPTNASFNKYVGASYWQSAINQTVVADEIDPLYIGLTVFAENIKEYLLAIHEKGGEWRYKKIECKRNRYQLPQELAVTPKFFEVVGGPTFRWQLDSIAFLVIPHHAQKTPQLVLGELTAYQKIFSQRPAKAHFFHEFTGNPQNRLDSYTHRQFGNQYPLAQVTSFADFGPNEYRLEYPNTTTDTASLQKQTLSFIAYTIKKYPFFTEHRLNKAAIWAKADSILQAPGDFRDKLKAYQQLTAQLNDAHFYFETAVPKSGVYPLMAKNINGRITVAGVIDPDLSATVEPGMEIVSLAGVPVKRYIDSLAAYFAGDTRLRNELAVSRLFGSANGNPLTVTLNNNGNEPVTVTLSYNKKLTLPPNFRSEHFRYQLHHDRTGYLRLTRWNHGDWINFFSLGEELAKLENIIFDLRGNGGGQELDMMQIASCFFKRPTALLFNTYQYLQKGQPELSGESILIPNPHLHLQHLTIRILADARTGCASEMFIKLLQRSGANVKVVAAENTTGSYAHLAQFILPFNIVLHTNVMAHSYLNKNRETIEYRGIHPDINVSIASYKDLAPYEDKLLQTALSDLTSSKNEYSKK